jgi:hypothetical protein
MTCKPNNEYILKRGEVGTLLEFTLEDDNGPVNLNGWTVTATARNRRGGDVAINDAACTLAPDQPNTGKGKGSYEFDTASADIPVGQYDLEFKGVAPGGRVSYFPKDKNTPYASLIVIDPLS